MEPSRCKECGAVLDDFDHILGLYCDQYCAEAKNKCLICKRIPSECNCEDEEELE